MAGLAWALCLLCLTHVGAWEDLRSENNALRLEVQRLRSQLLDREAALGTCNHRVNNLLAAANADTFFQWNTTGMSGLDVIELIRERRDTLNLGVPALPEELVVASAPTQTHLALTGRKGEMSVTWTTDGDTKTSTCKWGTAQGQLDHNATGSSHHYDLPLPPYRSGAIHEVVLTNLPAGTRVFYQCGDAEAGWGTEWSFVSEVDSAPTPDSPLRIAVTADTGSSENSQMVLDAIAKMDQELNFSFLTLSGDLSYANGHQPTWDKWASMIEPLATHIPFMVAVGNHEIFDLFVPFNERFLMPRNGFSNLWYSYNYQNVHVIALDSESVDYWHFGEQYKWLVKDLESVNRTETPWVMAKWHSPWYCSNTKHQGSGERMRKGFEELFFKHSVDLVISGHVHAYERCHATYNEALNPKGPVFLTVGNGGNHEGLYNHWESPSPAWSAARDAEFGFGSLSVHNASHAHWTMHRANDTAVIDDAWIVRLR